VLVFGIDRGLKGISPVKATGGLSSKCSNQESMLVVSQQKLDTGGVPAIDMGGM